MNNRYQSWGRYPKVAQQAYRVDWRDETPPWDDFGGGPVLPFGNGRSYGDSCLNNGGTLLDTRGLDRLISFDPSTGLLRCEAGVLLSEILAFAVPRGWFLPVTPGTQYVTVGGAIANDVHGKNHHRAGTFGCHVTQFELIHSDGTRRLCSPDQQTEWFAATLGGLGLTGLILWAEIRLKRITGPAISSETIKYTHLSDFFALSAASDQDYEYTVAWVDCLARGKHLGRGLFSRGNHAGASATKTRPARKLRIPFDPPLPLVNPPLVKAFNFIYYQPRAQHSHHTSHYEPFFYPLDKILNWNRIYGAPGFMQYQCVVPSASGQDATTELLGRIAAANTGSFLAVLKQFGNQPSPGLLSFPRPGVTLALDFSNQGAKTLALLESLDEVVRQAGGAVYPAKDARMSETSFKHYYPQWQQLIPYIDPHFSSSFWRRVTGEHA